MATFLFVLIGLIAGAVSGVVASIPQTSIGGSVAGVGLGLGSTVTFARRPGDNPLRTRGVSPTSAIGRIIDAVWRLASHMTYVLDGKLATARVATVEGIVRRIYELTPKGVDLPVHEKVHGALKRYLDALTGPEAKTLQGRLSNAYRACQAKDEPLYDLIEFAYDMGQEQQMLRVIQDLV
ncbi:hypothetical protein [Blastococcus mobilis]|uniref:hypothetical protein n=1 Tax=Blastococcus mobilis TaxID=1938746 RepID=UPI001130651F|nr:hypothetical protein [Blastococcus mobilis]